MRVIGYVRVSTEEQAAEGLSIRGQAERLSAYCEAQGWTLGCIYRDAGASGGTIERPGLRAALEAVGAGEADVFLVLKLDRLTRSAKHLYDLVETCEAANVRLAAVQDALDTGSANGRMVTGILAVLAQWEREMIAERTRAALQQKQLDGQHVGQVPYGFRLNGAGELVEDPGELAVIRRMKELRWRGASYQEIADRLNEEGIEARRGRWAKSTVRALVSEHLNARKARYAGASRG